MPTAAAAGGADLEARAAEMAAVTTAVKVVRVAEEVV